jgi:hypothetical protein
LVWIVDHESDVASDLSAFHRVDDPMTLDAEHYFSLAFRLSAYSGVIAARIYAEREAERASESSPMARRPAAEPEPATVSSDVALAMLSGDPMYAPERVESEA